SVAEAGSGSGALTLVLAHAVGPTGSVVSYDRRADFLRAARANAAAAGWAERIRFVERDVVVEGLDATELDAVVLDLPEPWQVVAAARAALARGGYLVTYSPTYNQLERSVREMRSAGFGPVDAEEVLVRALHVGEGGTRPDFEMLGHTGFLAFGRRRG
ncbi:tRNA (adenine-N(1)-)-methyltransferase, partial [mine drainage metagenome]